MAERRTSEKFTEKIYHGKESSPERLKIVLVQAEKVISKALADLKSCSEAGKAILRQTS